MSQGNMCRLCVDICEEYKSLYDESGNAKEVLQLMIHYFDQELFTGNKFNVMCMKCWRQISDFNSFQQSVYRTQRIRLLKEEEIDIKSEEEFISEENIASSNKEQPDGGDIFVISDSEAMDVSSSGDSTNTNDNVDYDDPVGVFIGGEFGSEDNSTEFPATVATLRADGHETLPMKDRSTGSTSQKLRTRKASDDLIAQWMPILKCICCTETCSTYSLLQHHFQDKHPLFNCQARCCGKNFSRRETFVDHIRLHFDSNAFTCKFCFMRQECRKTLALHIREHHPAVISVTANPGDDSNTVPLSSENGTGISAGSILNNSGEWKLSRTKYIRETEDFIAKLKPSLECYLCPEKYSSWSMFRQHFSENHPKNQCYITCCERKLTARFRILEHLQLHVNPDIFKCDLCETRHKTRDQLQSHLRKRHTTSIKYIAKTSKKKNLNMSDVTYQKSDELLAKWSPSTECAVCKKTFDTLTLLKCHFHQSHPGEDFYVECCQRKLQSAREINAHARYHVEPTGFKCKVCCIHYSHERSLIKHMRSAH